MKYFFVRTDTTGQGWVEEFQNINAALNSAASMWDKMCSADKARFNEFYVMDSANADLEAVNHCDGEYVRAWKLQGIKSTDEVQAEIKEVLEEIADVCEKRGYPRNGSNYDSMADEQLAHYRAQYPYYWI